ncbi:aminotransferase-like domain-containing protein [Kitasatospora indigofera]|uniref:aminotransferase-like domain-containing protein n=1 Tax=Kitasatospora indigofera TaxID=67307 RepID=UPI003696078B
MRIGVEQLVRALGGWQATAVPLVDALEGALREAVLDGRLAVGSALPAERRLADGLGVSRGTVVAALTRLRDTGWVRTRHGSASTVQLPPSSAERFAPPSADGSAGSIDLRRAVPAAPRADYLAATARAARRAGPALAQGGHSGAGLPELREAIAGRYTREGLPTRAEQILVTSGARAALALLAARLRPRVAAVENPTYPRAAAVLRGAGARLSGLRVTTDGWDEDQLRAAFAAARGGLAYLVPDFQNPTGALMDARTRQAVAASAAEHGVTVVADETLRDLHLSGPSPLPPRIPRAVLVGSASKTVWAGVRVGWIRSPGTGLIGELLHHPLCEPLSAAPMEQLVAVELLAALEPLLDRRRAELRLQRDHLAGLLADDARWRFTVPEGGLVLWLQLTGVRADTVTARAGAAGLHLAPGPAFAVDGALTHYLRVPYTPPVATLDRIARILDEACAPPAH